MIFQPSFPVQSNYPEDFFSRNWQKADFFLKHTLNHKGPQADFVAAKLSHATSIQRLYEEKDLTFLSDETLSLLLERMVEMKEETRLAYYGLLQNNPSKGLKDLVERIFERLVKERSLENLEKDAHFIAALSHLLDAANVRNPELLPLYEKLLASKTFSESLIFPAYVGGAVGPKAVPLLLSLAQKEWPLKPELPLRYVAAIARTGEKFENKEISQLFEKMFAAATSEEKRGKILGVFLKVLKKPPLSTLKNFISESKEIGRNQVEVFGIIVENKIPSESFQAELLKVFLKTHNLSELYYAQTPIPLLVGKKTLNEWESILESSDVHLKNFIYHYFVENGDPKKREPEIALKKASWQSSNPRTLLEAVYRGRKKLNQEDLSDFDLALEKKFATEFSALKPGLSDPKLAIGQALCRRYQKQKEWLDPFDEEKFVLKDSSPQFEYAVRNLYGLTISTLAQVCEEPKIPTSVSSSLMTRYSLLRNNQAAYERALSNEWPSGDLFGVGISGGKAAPGSTDKVLDALKDEIPEKDLIQAKDFLSKAQGGLKPPRNFLHVGTYYGMVYNMLWLRRQLFTEKGQVPRTAIRALHDDLMGSLKKMLKDRTQYPFSSFGSGLHTFAYTSALLAMGEDQELVRPVEEMALKLKDPASVPYFLEALIPDVVDAFTETAEKKIQLASPIGSVARAVPVRLSLYLYSKHPKIIHTKTDLLFEALQNYSKRLPLLWLHFLGQSPHSGDYGIACYYLIPTLPYYSEGITLLVNDPRLDAEKRTRLLEMRRALRAFLLHLLQDDKALAGTSNSNIYADRTMNMLFVIQTALSDIEEVNKKTIPEGSGLVKRVPLAPKGPIPYFLER